MMRYFVVGGVMVILVLLCVFAGLSTIEAYNTKTDEWFHVLPMSTRRSSVGVGVVNGEYRSLFSFTVCT